MTFEWMECRRFSPFKKKSTHPTQSHVKVHSMSILTGPPNDQNLGKRGPPFLLHFEFWWCRRWQSGGRGEKGAKLTTQELDCDFQQHSLTWGEGGGDASPALPPQSYTYMGDVRATVQQDTPVSTGVTTHSTCTYIQADRPLRWRFSEARVDGKKRGRRRSWDRKPFFSSYKIKKFPVVQKGGSYRK